jgi:hypothetical protein
MGTIEIGLRNCQGIGIGSVLGNGFGILGNGVRNGHSAGIGAGNGIGNGL